MITRKTYKIYTALLVIAMMFAMPSMDAYAQQANDIKKPTRERTKTDNKNKQEVKQDAAPAKKQETTPAKKQETTPAKKQEVKPAAGQDVKTATGQTPKQDNVKSPADTATKPVEPPKPKKQPLDTETVQFDGIDVSKHQGDINWDELKKNPKVKFVYIKATEGSDYIDPRYKQNIKEARRAGFKVGSYHFLTNRSSATSQFINFAKTANRDEQDLIPVIDVEVCKQWMSQQLRDSLKVFADLLEDYYGCKPMIYTSEKFFTKHLGRAFADYPLFIAKYNTVQPNVGYKWILWQFSDCGLFRKAVKGNAGEVDLSRFNKGCSITDLIYKPVKGKPKISVMDAVDKNKEKPATINLTEQGKNKEISAKQQKEEEQKKADRAKKANERDKRLAEEEAKKKAKEKAEADKKAKAQSDRNKREKERQQAKEKQAKEEAAAKQRKAAEQKAKADAEAKRKAAEKAEAEAKAKRKAAAQQAKEKSKQQSNTGKTNKSASLLGSSTSRMSQAQQGDSIRNARYQGRKTNKSSADND